MSITRWLLWREVDSPTDKIRISKKASSTFPASGICDECCTCGCFYICLWGYFIDPREVSFSCSKCEVPEFGNTYYNTFRKPCPEEGEPPSVEYLADVGCLGGQSLIAFDLVDTGGWAIIYEDAHVLIWGNIKFVPKITCTGINGGNPGCAVPNPKCFPDTRSGDSGPCPTTCHSWY